jgi:hypothetical protein
VISGGIASPLAATKRTDVIVVRTSLLVKGHGPAVTDSPPLTRARDWAEGGVGNAGGFTTSRGAGLGMAEGGTGGAACAKAA